MEDLPSVVVYLVMAEMTQQDHWTLLVVLFLDSSVLVLLEKLRLLGVQKSLG